MLPLMFMEQASVHSPQVHSLMHTLEPQLHSPMHTLEPQLRTHMPTSLLQLLTPLASLVNTPLQLPTPVPMVNTALPPLLLPLMQLMV